MLPLVWTPLGADISWISGTGSAWIPSEAKGEGEVGLFSICRFWLVSGLLLGDSGSKSGTSLGSVIWSPIGLFSSGACGSFSFMVSLGLVAVGNGDCSSAVDKPPALSRRRHLSQANSLFSVPEDRLRHATCCQTSHLSHATWGVPSSWMKGYS